VLVVAKQRIHVGIVHAGRTLTVKAADTTWRIHDDDGGLIAEVARTTTKPVARFKVHKPNHQGGDTRTTSLASTHPMGRSGRLADERSATRLTPGPA
jgi:hypothetical protein